MLPAYTAAILLSAFLLFLLQPMAAKLVLPALGGSASVWTTCMLFFQVVLLAGYLAAHLLTRWLGPRVQVLVHAVLLVSALPFATLDSAGSAQVAPDDASPVLWLLGWLASSVGLPFFVLSTTTPLFQRWFAGTTHSAAGDPYFLYVASNIGSLTALLGYPLLLEPALRLRSPWLSPWSLEGAALSQTLVWTVGYAGFALLALACGALMLKRRARMHSGPAAGADPSAGAPPVPWSRRASWILLAFAPCAAMLGATQQITSEIAAVPLFWVVPFALYLSTFILAFSRRTSIPSGWSGGALAVSSVTVAVMALTVDRPSAWLLVPLHLVALLAAGLVCHGRLARERPAPGRLTEFYLWIAVGGALGGSFNALLAPLLFDSFLEYPIALVAACLLWPRGTRQAERGRADRLLDYALPVALALLALPLSLGGLFSGWIAWITIGLAALACLACRTRPVGFALAVAVLFATEWVLSRVVDPPLHVERTFFGVNEVRQIDGPPLDAIDPRNGARVVIRIPFHRLIHGSTTHGSQALHEELRTKPTTYYHASGPIGQVFEALSARGQVERAGLIGLGAGTLAAYGRRGMHFDFFEIDAEVLAIARNERLFTYLRDCQAELDVRIGDGRRLLAREPDGRFGLIVVDAFSSDSVPVHLITRQAVALYLRKLGPRGLVAFHLSSQYLDLTRVVEAIASDLGLSGLVQTDEVTSLEQEIEGKELSTWALLARDETALASLGTDPRWQRLPRSGQRPPRRYLWTDDYSNVLGVLRLFGSADPAAGA